jgi:Flp pilus assembly protein TadD
MTEVELRSGEMGKAEQRAKAITGRNPSLSVGYRLQADVALARKSFSEAITGYRAALGKEASTEIAMRLYRALVQSGDPGAAIRFVETWLKDGPRDTAALRALAEAQALSGNLTAARTAYEQILQLEGDDPAVLNNLANILARQGDKRAIEVAEKAYRLAPRDAAIQDTLGWLLVQSGQPEVGLRHLREARLRAPDNAEIRYHLAATLARAGKKDEARRELEPALREGSTFDGQAEARKLLDELAGR